MVQYRELYRVTKNFLVETLVLTQRRRWIDETGLSPSIFFIIISKVHVVGTGS